MVGLIPGGREAGCPLRGQAGHQTSSGRWPVPREYELRLRAYEPYWHRPRTMAEGEWTALGYDPTGTVHQTMAGAYG